MTKNKKFILFGKPSFDSKELTAIKEVVESGWVGMGPKCEEFEKLFAKKVGSKYAISVSSCTAALHLAILASNVNPGDEIITTPLTFVATVNAIEYAGAKPILVDIDPQTLNIDTNKIEKAITPKTKAIIPVHFGGLPCDMKKIFSVAKKHNLAVIEDAAHAIGSVWEGRRIGGLKNSLACFSFYPNKNITSIEGGMITTDNKKISEFIKITRLHGTNTEAWKRYSGGKKFIKSEMIMQGFKYNLTDIQAAVGICQLKKLDRFQKIRNRYAKIYDKYFSELCGLQKRTNTKSRHAFHLYIVLLRLEKMSKTRDEIIQLIRDQGIGATIHYRPIHMQYYYQKKFGWKSGDFPIAENIYNRSITLPLTPSMSIDDANRVAKTVSLIIKDSLI